MRIGIDARFYGSVGKGLGRYTQKLIEHLEQIDDTNQYTVFLRRENFDEYQPKNQNFQKMLADYRWYSFGEQFGFWRLLRRYRFDLMHFPHFNMPILYCRKFVVTVHDLILLHFPTQRATTLHPWWYRLKFAMYRWVIRRAITGSQKVLTVSEFTKQDILKHYQIPGEKIAVTHEAADNFCRYQDPAKSLEILQKYGLIDNDKDNTGLPLFVIPDLIRDPERKTYDHRLRFRVKPGMTAVFKESEDDLSIINRVRPYFLYVGNAYPHKNLESLLAALDYESARDIFLVLVGKEDYFYKRLKDEVHRRGLQSVSFAGFVPDDELDVLYRYGRGYVFPSLYEGFGLPPLEAMARGLPVLAASSTCLPEVLGDAALYFDPGKENDLAQSMRKLWDDQSLRNDLQRRGYKQVALFDWRELAKKTLFCYHEMTREKP